MNKSVYTLKEQPGNGLVLFLNGDQTYCPFQPGLPIPVQNTTFGGGHSIKVIRQPCSTLCPLAEYVSTEDGENETLHLKCGASALNVIKLTKEEVFQKPPLKITGSK